jgi:hypothetical protein
MARLRDEYTDLYTLSVISTALTGTKPPLKAFANTTISGRNSN